MARCARAPLLAIGLLALAAPAGADDATVGSGTAGSCTESAFDAALAAVQASGGGTVSFACGPAAKVIVFSTAKSVAGDVTIDGGDQVTLSGGNANSIFQVFASATLTLRDLMLTRGYGPFGAVQSFGALVVEGSRLADNIAIGSGGAIESYGELALVDSVVEGNTADVSGGGILAEGDVTVIGGRIQDNLAPEGGGIAASATATVVVQGVRFEGNRNTAVFGQGGAIRSEGALTVAGCEFVDNGGSRGGALSVMSGVATVASSRFQGNYASYGSAIRQVGGELAVTDSRFTHNGYAPNGSKVSTGGGAISWGAGTATIERVTIDDNWASYGGGLDHADGTVTLTNVTLSGNEAVGGGAIDQGGGSLELVNVTIADNAASFFAGGLAARAGTASLRNVLLSGNVHRDTTAPFNCSTTLAGAVFSLSSDSTCGFGGARNNVDAKLAALADNGGGTPTHRPLAGSPAIDAGTGNGCPATDQRGVARPQGEACDVGAVEVPEPAAERLATGAMLALAAVRLRARLSRTGCEPRRDE